MRLPLVLPLALLLVLPGCHHKVAKAGSAKTAAATSTQAEPGTPAATGAAMPDGRSAAQKEAEARIKAAHQLQINDLQDLVGDLQDQGITVHKTPKHKAWRLVVPSLQKVADPTARKAQAADIAKQFETKVEAILQHPTTVEVFTDEHEHDQVL